MDLNVEYKMMKEFVDGTRSVKNDQKPEQKECMEKNEPDEDMEVDPSCINRVCLTDKREQLRVTVEIKHPALSLPAYLTWTGN